MYLILLYFKLPIYVAYQWDISLRKSDLGNTEYLNYFVHKT